MAATGIGGGFFAGLTGVGGGAIMVPLMTGVLRMRQHTAHGTSLAVIVFAALASVITYSFADGVDWGMVGVILPASLAGAYAGARVVQRLPAMRLRQVFGLFILAIGLRMLLFADVEPLLSAAGWREAATAGAIGAFGGFTAGALGVGGGAVFVPGLVLLLGTSQHDAQGISLGVIVATAVVAAWTHYRHGSMDLRAAAWVAPFAVPAGIAGGLVASGLGADALQRIFAVVVSGVGAQMAFTATRVLRHERELPAARGAEAL